MISGVGTASSSYALRSEHAAWGRRSLLTGMLLCGFGSGISQISYSTIIGEIAATYGVSLGVASFALLGMMIFVMAVGVPIAGLLADRFGVFSVLIGSQLLFVSSFVALPLLAHSFPLLVGSRAVQGLCAAGVAGALTPAMSRYFPPEQIGRAMGIQTMGLPLGMLVGLLLVPRLTAAAGDWRFGLAYLGVFGGLALLPIVCGVRWLPRELRSTAVAADESGSLQEALALPLFRYGVVISILLYATGFTLTDLAPGFLAVAPPVGVGLGPQRAGALISLLMLSGLVAPLLAGFLVDRVFGGKVKTVMVIGWAVALLPPLLVLPAIHHSPQLLSVFLLIGGFAQPFVSITLMTSAARVFRKDVVGRIAGLWLCVSFFSAALGTMLGSLGLHVTGRYLLPLALVWIGNLIGLTCALLAKDPVSMSRQEPS